MGGRGCVWNDFALIDKKLQYDFGDGLVEKNSGKYCGKKTKNGEMGRRGCRKKLQGGSVSDFCRMTADCLQTGWGLRREMIFGKCRWKGKRGSLREVID